MSQASTFALMAGYNQWMNENVYAAAAKLSANELAQDRGAFFGSVLGTLNHIYVGDTLWLKRFCGHPDAPKALDPIRVEALPASLDAIPFTEFAQLKAAREARDDLIIDFVRTLPTRSYEIPLEYSDTKGIPMKKPLGFLLQHFFNHQTHHRGQVTTLLSQQGIDPGVTDLLAQIDNV
ncbi:MAG: DinB family protein [Pseudomonadota bacterium]